MSVASGSSSWRCFLAGEPDKVATGAPLVFVVACLLGYEPFERLPPWLLRVAAELELEVGFDDSPGRNHSA